MHRTRERERFWLIPILITTCTLKGETRMLYFNIPVNLSSSFIVIVLHLSHFENISFRSFYLFYLLHTFHLLFYLDRPSVWFYKHVQNDHLFHTKRFQKEESNQFYSMDKTRFNKQGFNLMSFAYLMFHS